MYNHHANANQSWYEALNDTPGRVGPPIEPPPESIRQYFHDWMERDGYPFWPFWENIRSWWAIRDLPNVLLLHFEQLKQDLPGEMRRVADFLDVTIDESKWPDMVKHCSFDYMKAHATASVPLGGAFWDGGAKTFINKGVNGRWRDTLSAEESAAYRNRAVAELGEDCARWLETGMR
jgi:aryl sulfotransferase